MKIAESAKPTKVKRGRYGKLANTKADLAEIKAGFGEGEKANAIAKCMRGTSLRAEQGSAEKNEEPLFSRPENWRREGGKRP